MVKDMDLDVDELLFSANGIPLVDRNTGGAHNEQQNGGS